MGDTAIDQDADDTPSKTPDTTEQTPDIFKASIFKFKKRVQFLPDDDLVRVREIPPRSNRSSLEESDDPDSDSNSDSDKSWDTESSTDTDESSDSDSDTASSKQALVNTTVTPPPSTLAPNNTPGLRPRASSLTSPAAFKVNRSPASISNSTTTHVRRTRAALKLEAPTRRDSGDILDLTTVTKSRTPLVKSPHKPDINVPSLPQPKNSKLYPSFKPTGVNPRILTNRGVQGAPQNKHSPTKRKTAISVTTSLDTVPSVLGAQVAVIKQSLQTVTIGQLYTMDGFIFPSHQAADPRLPTILPSKVTNMVSRANSSSDRRGGLVFPSTPHKVVENGGTISSMPMSKNENLHQSAQGGKRHYAWQMANGSPQGTLQNTPNIAQLWDDASMTSPAVSLRDSVSDSK